MLLELMIAFNKLVLIAVGMAERSKAIGLRVIGEIRGRFKSYSPNFLFISRALSDLKQRQHFKKL